MADFDPFARQIFSGNDYVSVANGNAIDVINPASLEPVGKIADCDAATLDNAIQQARVTQVEWGATDASSPAAALHFGGRKLSGIGSLFGRAGLNSFRQIKMVTLDPKPIIQDWWYPYPDDWFHSGSGRT